MNIKEIDNCTPALTEQLLKIWENAVRRTHTFLPEDEIMRIKGYIPEVIQAVGHLLVSMDEDEVPIAFIGIDRHRIEMLFVDADRRGQGIGSLLVRYATDHFGADEVTVNEQNPQAIGFYEHMGFHTYKRTDLDEQGAPYPLLYMKNK